MGLLGRFRKKKEMVYHFLYQRAGEKGWIPIDKYDSEVAAEDLEPIMTEAGTYTLQKRVGGRIVGVAWSKKVEGVAEGEGERERVESQPRLSDSDRIAKAIEDDMVRAVRWFKLPEMIQSAIKQAFGGENPIEGMAAGVVTAKTLKEQLRELRGEYEDLHGIFGSSTDTQSKKIPVKGEIPAWLVYLPDVADQIGDTVEKRLDKWGLLGESKTRGRILSMPEKPLAKKRLDLSKIKKGGAEKGGEKGGEGGEKSEE